MRVGISRIVDNNIPFALSHQWEIVFFTKKWIQTVTPLWVRHVVGKTICATSTLGLWWTRLARKSFHIVDSDNKGFKLTENIGVPDQIQQIFVDVCRTDTVNKQSPRSSSLESIAKLAESHTHIIKRENLPYWSSLETLMLNASLYRGRRPYSKEEILKDSSEAEAPKPGERELENQPLDQDHWTVTFNHEVTKWTTRWSTYFHIFFHLKAISDVFLNAIGKIISYSFINRPISVMFLITIQFFPCVLHMFFLEFRGIFLFL